MLGDGAAHWCRNIKVNAQKLLVALTVIAAALLTSNPASADTGMNINGRSKIMILGGYSIISHSTAELKLRRQDITSVHKHLVTILPTLRHDLQVILGALVDYVSEGDLKRRLIQRRLDTSDPDSIKTLLREGDFSHLITADVEMVGNAGEVSIHVAELLPNLTATLELLPGQRLTEAQTALEGVSDEILLDVVRLRAADAPKTVHISCIYPKNPVVGAYTLELQLERTLSTALTPKLIAFYQRKEMQERGYRPIVHNGTWKIEVLDKKVLCSPATPVRVIPTRVADYSILGQIAVVRTASNINKVDVAIEFVRNLPPPSCRGPIPIDPHEFDSAMLYQQPNFSSSFPQQILPALERAWMDNKSCS